MGYGHSIRGTTLTPVAWFGDHIGLVIAVALVGATLALALWRLHARRSQSELSSGVATVFLAFMAIAVPTGWALWWDGVTGWAFWWAAFVALTAAALASTEWLRASLRWFAVLAIVALSALLLRLGSSDVDAARCAEVRTLATDVTNLDKEKTHLVGAAKTSAEEARNDLSTMIQEQKGSPGLLTPAQNLVTALDSGNGDALKVATTALDAAYRPNEATREDTGLVAAADSAVAATRALTALDAVERPPAVAALDKEACGARPRLVSDVELSKARSATAAFRSSLLPTEVNIAAAKSLAAAEDEATARLARGEADEGTAWVSRIELGATVAGAAALSWLPGSPEPDKWFWVVVAVLLLGAWWLVERRSASMVAGPVSVTFQGAEIGEADKGKQPTKDAQQSVFVTALTKNLREPGATPGSQSSSPLTDLEGVVSAADPSKLLTAIIAVLKKVMSSPRGSTVSAQVLAPLPGDSRWRIFVVVADAATGKSVASKEVPNDSAAEACRVAGYWAAATVLSSSPRIPVWARWSPATAHAFAAYDSASEPTVEALRLALREAPASSLVLHKLADQLSLAGKYASAGELYARAVVVDPTDHTSLYRLAATVAALSRPGSHWNDLSYTRRAALEDLFNRAAQRAGVSTRIDRQTTQEEQNSSFAVLAPELLERLYGMLQPRAVAKRYFRRDQRDAIGPLMRVLIKFGPAARSRAALRAAGLSVGAFGTETDALEKTTVYAADPRSGWHVCYNLACYYAQQEDGADMAIAWLETALTRPGVEELDGAWLAKDPDLEALATRPRFLLLRNSLASGPEE